MKKVLVLILSVFVPILLIGATIYAVSSQNEKPPVSQEEVKDLDLNVRFSSTTVEVTNNEETTLTGCQATVNGDFGATIEIPAEPKEYNLASFTKDNGERFNPIAYKANKIHIYSCKEHPDRMAYYGN